MDAGQLRHGAVGKPLHPRCQGFGALELARGIVVQDFLRLGNCGSGPDFPGHGFLRGNDPVEFAHAPRVRFLQIHRGSEEGPRREGIPFPPHGVLVRRHRQQFILQERGKLGVRCPGGGSAVVEVFLERLRQRAVGCLGAGRQLREEAVLSGVPGGLLDHDAHLAPGGDPACRLGRAE